MSIPDRADYIVRGFRGTLLLVETWHVGEASKDLEVSCWRDRMQRGEATHVEVINRHSYKMETLTR